MRASAFVVAAAIVVVSAASVVRAHHSYAEFDVERTVTIHGTIENILFANPHVVLKVRAGDATLYTATWNAARQLTRQGVSATRLNVGDAVVVIGSPSKISAEVSKLVEVSRPSDRWAWRMKPFGAVEVTP